MAVTHRTKQRNKKQTKKQKNDHQSQNKEKWPPCTRQRNNHHPQNKEKWPLHTEHRDMHGQYLHTTQRNDHYTQSNETMVCHFDWRNTPLCLPIQCKLLLQSVFYTYIHAHFVCTKSGYLWSLVEHGVLILVSEIRCYRNDTYYYNYINTPSLVA